MELERFCKGSSCELIMNCLRPRTLKTERHSSWCVDTCLDMCVCVGGTAVNLSLQLMNNNHLIIKAIVGVSGDQSWGFNTFFSVRYNVIYDLCKVCGLNWCTVLGCVLLLQLVRRHSTKGLPLTHEETMNVTQNVKLCLVICNECIAIPLNL